MLKNCSESLIKKTKYWVLTCDLYFLIKPKSPHHSRRRQKNRNAILCRVLGWLCGFLLLFAEDCVPVFFNVSENPVFAGFAHLFVGPLQIINSISSKWNSSTDVAWKIWPFSNLSQQHPACCNVSQQDGQTRTTWCYQRCHDMLRWDVAIVWPELKITCKYHPWPSCMIHVSRLN